MELFAKRMTWELDNDEGLSCLFFWSVIIKVKSPNARKGDKIITLRRDSKWENGIQARNAGRR